MSPRTLGTKPELSLNAEVLAVQLQFPARTALYPERKRLRKLGSKVAQKQALLLRIFSATPVAERNMARKAPRSCGSEPNISGSRTWPQEDSAVPRLKSNRGKAATATLGDRAAKDSSLRDNALPFRTQTEVVVDGFCEASGGGTTVA